MSLWSTIESRLLTLNCRDNLARMTAGTELEVPNTLPGAGRQTTIGDGNIHRGADKGRLDMSLKRRLALQLQS